MIIVMAIAGQMSGVVAPRYMISAGMLIIALSMWYFTSLSSDAGFAFFAWSRVLQTIGLPFVFITITAVSYAGLPADKTGEASSLVNVARNLGGSIGISVAGTALARGTQIHQAYLSDHLVPSSAQYQSAMQQASAVLAARGVPQPTAASQALAMIARTVQQQSALLAYIDVFAGFAVMALVLAPLALFLIRSGPATTVAAH
jgi:MFS transporter, DHA2 family, multidrug resistance protein